jgi:hypothetical protein
VDDEKAIMGQKWVGDAHRPIAGIIGGVRRHHQ